MTQARLGHAAEARQWLEKAMAWIDDDARAQKPDANPQGWPSDMILQHLRREAEALLPADGAR